MFQDGVAFDTLEHAIGERKVLGIRREVHSGKREEIEINVAVRARASTADIEVPAPEGSIDPLFVRVQDERNGWSKPSAQFRPP
jgi:hypothetical protein